VLLRPQYPRPGRDRARRAPDRGQRHRLVHQQQPTRAG
jgi:hypothetical protein